MVRSILIVLSATFVFVAPRTASAQATGLSGVWALDSIASDTLPVPEAESSRRRASVIVRPGPVRGRFPGPYTRSIHDPELLREALVAIGDRPERLFIAATDTVVTISRDGAPPFVVRPDRRERKELIANGVRADVEARWDGSRLRIERRLETGLEIVETYTPDGSNRLTVRVEARGPIPRSIDVRWRYERSERSAPPGSTTSKSST